MIFTIALCTTLGWIIVFGLLIWITDMIEDHKDKIAGKPTLKELEDDLDKSIQKHTRETWTDGFDRGYEFALEKIYEPLHSMASFEDPFETLYFSHGFLMDSDTENKKYLVFAVEKE